MSYYCCTAAVKIPALPAAASGQRSKFYYFCYFKIC